MKEFRNYDILVDITSLAGHRKSIVEQMGVVAIFEGDLPVFATHRFVKKKTKNCKNSSLYR